MKKLSIHSIVLATFSGVAALLVGGCAHQPSAEAVAQVAKTQTSIQQAEQSGAMRSALQDLQAAKDKLQQAQVALEKKTNKDDRRALYLAQQAELDAQYAAAKAQSDAQRQAADEVRRSIESLRQEASRTAPAG